MKVLYVTDPGADYLSDQIYDGLCSVLERQNVIDFPAKPLYHDQPPAPHLTQNPDDDSALHDVESMIRERRIDLMIVSSPRSGAMEAFRRQTADATRSYLDSASEADLNSPRLMISDPGQTRLLRPADVIMRVVTHIFNHQGQVLAMCRAIGKPNDKYDLDYPVD